MKYLSGICLAVALFTVGCSGDSATQTANDETKAKKQEHSHPTTFDEAVEQLVALDQKVRSAFAANDEDTAHGPLHDVGHLLESVSELAKKDLGDEQQAGVQAAVEKLFEVYGAVDDTMHGKEGKSYKDVTTDIDEALKTLTGQSATTEGSDDESTK